MGNIIRKSNDLLRRASRSGRGTKPDGCWSLRQRCGSIDRLSLQQNKHPILLRIGPFVGFRASTRPTTTTLFRMTE